MEWKEDPDTSPQNCTSFSCLFKLVWEKISLSWTGGPEISYINKAGCTLGDQPVTSYQLWC